MSDYELEVLRGLLALQQATVGELSSRSGVDPDLVLQTLASHEEYVEKIAESAADLEHHDTQMFRILPDKRNDFRREVQRVAASTTIDQPELTEPASGSSDAAVDDEQGIIAAEAILSEVESQPDMPKEVKNKLLSQVDILLDSSRKLSSSLRSMPYVSKLCKALIRRLQLDAAPSESLVAGYGADGDCVLSVNVAGADPASPLSSDAKKLRTYAIRQWRRTSLTAVNERPEVSVTAPAGVVFVASPAPSPGTASGLGMQGAVLGGAAAWGCIGSCWRYRGIFRFDRGCCCE